MDNMTLPRVVGEYQGSNKELERRLLLYIKIEQEKIMPDNALIAVLCDSTRVIRECSMFMNQKDNQ